MNYHRFIFCLIVGLSVVWAKTTPTPVDNDIPPEDDFEECSVKKKCKEAFTICRDGTCRCKQGYIADVNLKCVKAPTVGEKCALADGSILDCVGSGVDAGCPSEGSSKDKCHCISGYEQVGRACRFKDQNINEKCDSDVDCGVSFSTCQNKKCACMEGFKADRGICVSDHKCPSDAEPLKEKDGKAKTCEIKYVRQSSSPGHARVARGFRSFPRDSANHSKKGDAKKSESRASGGEHRGNGGHETLVDSCPESTHYCFHHPLVRSGAGSFVGHCCPRTEGAQKGAKPVCPFGEPIKVDVCASESDSDDTDGHEGEDSDGGDTNKGNAAKVAPRPKAKPSAAAAAAVCPSLTHTCVYAANATAACCPAPCQGQLSFFSANGRCYETLAPGQTCKFDLQCGRGGMCGEEKGKKVCVCKDDYTLKDDQCEKTRD